MIDATGREVRLQVDGGIDSETSRRAREAGADTLVAGSAVFGHPGYGDAITALRQDQ